MSDGITEAYEVERNVNEQNKEYINEIINAEFDKSKIVQRRYKVWDQNNIIQNGWHTFPKGEYDFKKYEYRIKDQNANINDENLHKNLSLIGKIVSMNHSPIYHMITGYDSNMDQVVMNGRFIKMEDFKKNYTIYVSPDEEYRNSDLRRDLTRFLEDEAERMPELRKYIDV